MKYRGVLSTNVDKNDDIRKFFDGIANDYIDKHGNPDKLLKYRVKLLKREAAIYKSNILLEVCCGVGDHLIALAGDIAMGVGIDFSPEMINVANKRISNKDLKRKISFRVDNATCLDSLDNESVDIAICIGSLEHIPDKASVITTIYRVLKSSGRFVCLTVNDSYLWHAKIAPFFNFNTRHLSSDKFLRKNDIEAMISQSLFIKKKIGYWSFVPRGDMPFVTGIIFLVLDKIGRLFRLGSFRGGIFFTLEKP